MEEEENTVLSILKILSELLNEYRRSLQLLRKWLKRTVDILFDMPYQEQVYEPIQKTVFDTALIIHEVPIGF